MLEYFCTKNIMKRLSFIPAIVLIIALNLQAFASGHSPKSSAPAATFALTGVVTDKTSGEKLAGVTIRLNDTDQKIYSDSKGEFNLKGIAPGTYKVKVNFISYKEKEMSVKITLVKNDKLTIQLTPVEP